MRSRIIHRNNRREQSMDIEEVAENIYRLETPLPGVPRVFSVYLIKGEESVLLEPGPRGVGMRLLVAALVSALVSLLLARYLAAPLGQLSRASRQRPRTYARRRTPGMPPSRAGYTRPAQTSPGGLASRATTSVSPRRRRMDQAHPLRARSSLRTSRPTSPSCSRLP